uniref:ADP-ribosylation factor-like protein 5B n=1 Tax=Sphaerodactylus townsendi TaxID=933632 RepID=A0ACB8FVS9_9SAUR
MGLLFAKLWSLFINQGKIKKYLFLENATKCARGETGVSAPSPALLADKDEGELLLCVTPQHMPEMRRQWHFRLAEHKVIIVGLDNAGKTTILYQFLMNEVVHTSPTIGSNVEEIVVKNAHFLMWDIGGQESLRSSWNTYYSNTEFIILVVDSIDRERLSVTKEELYRMLAHEDLRKAAVLIFANKQDMKGCMSAAEISKYLTLSSLKDHPWHIQSCCALTGEGLCQGLEWMTSRIGVK